MWVAEAGVMTRTIEIAGAIVIALAACAPNTPDDDTSSEDADRAGAEASLATLSGRYSFSSAGTIDVGAGRVLYSEVGVIDIDGAGNLTITQRTSYSPDVVTSTCRLSDLINGAGAAACTASTGLAFQLQLTTADVGADGPNELRFSRTGTGHLGRGVANRQSSPVRANDLAKNWAFGTRGTLGGLPYAEVGSIRAIEPRRGADAGWQLRQRRSPVAGRSTTSELLATTCTPTVEPSGVGVARCGPSLTIWFAVVPAHGAQAARLRFFAVGADATGAVELLGNGVAHAQIGALTSERFAGRYGYDSSGTLDGAAYREVGIFDAKLDGTLRLTQQSGAFDDERVVSSCALDLETDGLGVIECEQDELGNVTTYVSSNGQHLDFFSVATREDDEVLINAGGGDRQGRVNKSRLAGRYGHLSDGVIKLPSGVEIPFVAVSASKIDHGKVGIDEMILGNAVHSDCNITALEDPGIGVLSCTASTGNAYRALFSVDREGSQLHYYLAGSATQGGGTALR